MAEYVTTYPTAHKRHRCCVCGWDVMPGEKYSRQVVFDDGSACTWKMCLWCERVGGAYCRASGYDEYDQGVLEWLEDSHHTVWGQMCAGWRYPDGERIPLPLQPRCVACGRLLDFWGLWCDPCDRARIARLSEQLLGLMA